MGVWYFFLRGSPISPSWTAGVLFDRSSHQRTKDLVGILAFRVGCFASLLIFFCLLEIIFSSWTDNRKKRDNIFATDLQTSAGRCPACRGIVPVAQRWLLRRLFCAILSFLSSLIFFNTTTTRRRRYTDRWNWRTWVSSTELKYPQNIILRCCFNSLKSLKSLGFLDGVSIRV